MKVVFRVDASDEIGTGHLMRCLTLAKAIKTVPCSKIMFVCRNLPEYLQRIIFDNHFELYNFDSSCAHDLSKENRHSAWLGVSQKKDAQEVQKVLAQETYDWMVVDHYALDYRWESIIQQEVKKILVIDDLADRDHFCSALLDQNIYPEMKVRYKGKVPHNCKLFLGPKYVLLGSDFVIMRQYVKKRERIVKNILVSFGGADLENNTGRVLEALMLANINDLNITVVVGRRHRFIREIQQVCVDNNYTFYVQTNKMADLICKADLAIGSGGISTYERLYLGLPALLKPISFNQKEVLTYMSSIGLFDIYDTQQVLIQKLRKIVENNTLPPDCIEEGSKKILKFLLNESTVLKSPSSFDIRRTYKWLQDDQLRKDFCLSEKPTRSVHFKYWRELMDSHNQKAYSIVYSGEHIGNCGLKNINYQTKDCELWVYIANTSFRGCGIASNVIKKLLSISRNKFNCTSVYLHVAKENSTAINLYKKFDFVLSDEPFEKHPLFLNFEVLFMRRNI